MLFVELALIRWTGSNVVYLSYFSNFVLLGSFLGIGLGFLRARATRGPLPVRAARPRGCSSPSCASSRSRSTSTAAELIFFGELPSAGPAALASSLAVIFLAVAAVMAFIGEGVGRAVRAVRAARGLPARHHRQRRRHRRRSRRSRSCGRRPSRGASSSAWCFLAPARPRRSGLLQVARLVAALVIVLGVESFAAGTSWSPYYKVDVRADESPAGSSSINVNGVPHQAIQRRRPSDPICTNGLRPRAQRPARRRAHHRRRRRATTSPCALRAGAEARRRRRDRPPAPRARQASSHPDHPYQDPRVDVHIDDGRAFLERTDKKYDLILFALPDSLTLVSGQSSLRLESYLFTKEAIEAARDHLEPGGVFAMYNYYRRALAARPLAGTLARGVRPAAVPGRSSASVGDLAVARSSRQRRRRRAAPTPCGRSAADPTPTPATDDHPFPYLRTASIPALPRRRSALILLASLLAVRVVARAAAADARRTPTCSSWAPRSCCSRRRTSCSSRCCSAPPGSSTRSCSPACCSSVLFAVEVVATRHVQAAARACTRAARRVLVVALVVPPSCAAVARRRRRGSSPRWSLAFAPIFIANLVFAQRFQDVAIVDHGVRREPARRDGRRAARVRRADRRLPRAAHRRRGPLRARLRVRPPAPRRDRRAR